MCVGEEGVGGGGVGERKDVTLKVKWRLEGNGTRGHAGWHPELHKGLIVTGSPRLCTHFPPVCTWGDVTPVGDTGQLQAEGDAGTSAVSQRFLFFFFFFIFSHHSFFAAKIKHMNVQSDPRLRLDQLTPLACGVTRSAVLSEANDVKCKMTSNANVTKIKTSNSRTDEVSPDLRPLVRRLYPSSSHTRAPLTSKGAVVNLK